jgi:hypothetical protein
MSDTGPVFSHTLQQEIDDLREQAVLLPPGRKRNRVLARADALEVTMRRSRGQHHRPCNHRGATAINFPSVWDRR